MHAGNPQTMARHADEPGEPFVVRRDHRRNGAVGCERRLPLVGLHQVVELDQIDVIDAEPCERTFEFGPGSCAVALTRLRREEEAGPVVGEERCEPELRLPVGRRGVEMVDACGIDDLQRGVGALLTHPTECGSTEDHSGGLVTGAAERSDGEHVRTVAAALTRHGLRPPSLTRPEPIPDPQLDVNLTKSPSS